MTFAKSPLSRTKPRKCPECHQPYVKTRAVQPTCGALPCQESYAIKVAHKAAWKREKMQRAADRAQREELQPLQYWLKRAEKAVNALVRERDIEQPCISCGTNDAAEWHAGHWKSVGSNSALRYDLSNIHRQCDQCNVFKGGNATEYEARLPARIGQAEVDRLKNSPRSRKWTREECQAIEADAKRKLKELKHG